MTNSEKLDIDARGMKCPRPIIELAKARRRLTPGSIIKVVADDLAFESDVRAWCETAGNRLVELEKSGKVTRATIEILESKRGGIDE
jgi:TusA-related sulfurtransferase